MNKPRFAGLLTALLGVCLIPPLAMAQSAIEGTWKIDLKRMQMPKKPDVLLLQDGMYQCKTCVPPVSVKADGTDQPVTGHPYYDMLAVKVIDDHTIQETEKKDGKVISTSTTTVADDGKTASFNFTENNNNNADPITGQGSMTRVAKGPAGSHAISGSWRTSGYGDVSDNALTRTYKVEGDSLSMSAPTGESYTAKMDGSDAPYNGDPGTTSVSVVKLGKHVVQETSKRDGKVVSVAKMTISADGKSMTIAINDKLHGSNMSFVAMKQ
ncbi:hypothetical protein [Rhodanobacter sp. FDAARGOS 1247]|uniref:hypothetical protein n=1 Tax=Rhodanobacter sp. FDAARGOS 1247 TaxID=2778082 RepID=UPI001EF43752|nr:hypothetical protein [Rhodanobacter sp. FDAARGOS 1247]